MRASFRFLNLVFHPLLLSTWVVLVFGSINKYAFGVAPVGRMALVVFINTCFFPVITLLLMSKLRFIPDLQLTNKQDRTIPFFAVMTFYIWSFMVVRQMQMPVFVQVFVLGATISIALSFLVNIFYRISLHMVGMGCLVMLLIILVFHGGKDIAHLVVAGVLLAGLVGSARMSGGGHTPNELYFGILVGMAGQIGAMMAFYEWIW